VRRFTNWMIGICKGYKSGSSRQSLLHQMKLQCFED